MQIVKIQVQNLALHWQPIQIDVTTLQMISSETNINFNSMKSILKSISQQYSNTNKVFTVCLKFLNITSTTLGHNQYHVGT